MAAILHSRSKPLEISWNISAHELTNSTGIMSPKPKYYGRRRIKLTVEDYEDTVLTGPKAIVQELSQKISANTIKQ